MLADDFEYPMPKRETNWTLKNEKKRNVGASTAPRQMNRTDDISGAKTGSTALYRATLFTNKTHAANTTSGIQGASPKRQIPMTVNKPNERNIHNNDIEHSYPESKIFCTPRIVDPLNPTYVLPAVTKRPPTPPVFKTETLKIHDIDGTKPKPFRVRSEVRNPMDYSDIPLSHAGSKEAMRKRKTASMMLETRDITADDRRMTTRHVSPLEPMYTMPGAGRGQYETIGEIAGSHPRKMPQQRNDRPMMSLTCSDIAGSSPGNNVPYPKAGRRGWKKTGDISDINTKGRRKL